MQRELGSLPGVTDVQTDQKTQRVSVTVDVDLTTPDEVEKQLESAGFPAA